MNKIEQIKAELKRLKNDWASLDDELTDTMVAEYDYLLDFLSTLESEKPMKQEELEEEYKDYVVNDPVYSKLVNRNAGLVIARHFAQWQKQHDAELIEIAYNDGITIGMTKQKEQMMKEAVEGEVAPQEDTRPSASERLDLLRARIRDAVKGYDPFRVRTRNAKAVAWRQCVYLLLKNEGYTLHAIADASGYNHATIAWGIKHAKDLVDIGDSEYKRIWNAVNYIDEGWR